MASLYQARTEEQLPNATELTADLARALGFLSRLPVPARFFDGFDGSMARTSRVFPLAGLLIALVPALLLALAPAPPGGALLCALLALALMAFVSGGLHEDGLADSADGLFGGRDKAQALGIMKDSRIGTYGVIALILSFGLRASALSALMVSASGTTAALALLAAAGFSRGLMVWHWHRLPPARDGGTAAAVGQPLNASRTLALVLGTLFVLLLPVFGVTSVLGTLYALMVAAAGAVAVTRQAQRAIGGHTGDTIGATQQVTETLFLCALAIFI